MTNYHYGCTAAQYVNHLLMIRQGLREISENARKFECPISNQVQDFKERTIDLE